jgi:hypothetical protein
MTEQKAGLFLDMEPGEAKPVAATYFNSWTENGGGDTPKLKQDSVEEAQLIKEILTQWSSEDLHLPEIHPSFLAGEHTFEQFYQDRGLDGILKETLEKIVAAGFAVYESRTRIVIYHLTDIVDHTELMPA